MRSFETTNFTVKDLYDAYKRGELVISPKFQRRAVWQYKAKSYLIDTLLRGLPIPLIFIREQLTSQEGTFRQTREVVDGQQRLGTIFDYIDNGFAVSKSHNEEYGGLRFHDLPQDVAQNFLQYSIPAIRLVGRSDNEITDIFARLNTYSIVLNTQELLHSQYFGEYKNAVDELSSRYRAMLLGNRIITDKSVARMADKKIITDILDPIVTGQIRTTNQKNLKKVYEEYDDSFEAGPLVMSRVSSMIDLLANAYHGALSDTIYRRGPVFSSAVIAMYKTNWPLADFTTTNGIVRLSESNMSQLKTALDEVGKVAEEEQTSLLTKEEMAFREAISRQTTNVDKICIRINFIEKIIKNYLG